ncbi:unnamed protein product [Microthlaspi erraticum]|uniref:Uncharacterized protein n=1 Tax=Microthlaspi erraticum TaxID=1685480 RepID=A0A6D2HVY4_9BRAS|nr:unnamed protein product [Microthlaspi erraticum]
MNKKTILAKTWMGKNQCLVINTPLIKTTHFKYCKELAIESLEYWMRFVGSGSFYGFIVQRVILGKKVHYGAKQRIWTLNQFNAPASTLDGARKRSTQWISSRPVPCVLQPSSIENPAPNRAKRLAEERMFRARPKHIRPSEVSAKVPTGRRHDPGTSRGRPRHNPTPRRARPCRASREAKPRGRDLSRVPRPMSVRAGKNVPRPAEKPSAKFPPVRPRRPTVKSSGHDRSDSARPDCPADRPDRPSERRGRPEAVFEAQSAQFKPKAGADLARLG